MKPRPREINEVSGAVAPAALSTPSRRSLCVPLCLRVSVVPPLLMLLAASCNSGSNSNRQTLPAEDCAEAGRTGEEGVPFALEKDLNVHLDRDVGRALAEDGFLVG